jgi:hypothetical protein
VFILLAVSTAVAIMCEPGHKLAIGRKINSALSIGPLNGVSEKAH